MSSRPWARPHGAQAVETLNNQRSRVLAPRANDRDADAGQGAPQAIVLFMKTQGCRLLQDIGQAQRHVGRRSQRDVSERQDITALALLRRRHARRPGTYDQDLMMPGDRDLDGAQERTELVAQL